MAFLKNEKRKTGKKKEEKKGVTGEHARVKRTKTKRKPASGERERGRERRVIKGMQ